MLIYARLDDVGPMWVTPAVLACLIEAGVSRITVHRSMPGSDVRRASLPNPDDVPRLPQSIFNLETDNASGRPDRETR